ncbi:integrase, catalytic region, zinc finger, CCHC-type containing protein [Tanacetum coccineum]
MMLLARAITQKFSTPTNNRLRTSSNTRNQAIIQDGRVDIQTKNEGYGGNGNKNTGRHNRNQTFNAGTWNDERNQIVQRFPRIESTPGKANVQCYNCNEKGYYSRDCQKPRVRDAKYFREQMLLAIKDETRSNLNNEENDFMLDTSSGEETMEELTAVVMLMARIQLVDSNTETVPSYDAKAVSEKFMGTVRFGNDHFAAITGYGDYVQGNLMMCHVYYVEGLGHNLFSVRQFCDGDLEVAFHLNTCYLWNLEGDDLLTGSRDSNIYTISIFEMVASSPVYTWVYFLRTKDEALNMIIDFVNQVQRNLKARILTIRTDNGTEFKNEKLRAFYAKLGIVHKTSIARTPQQNGVVER